MNQPDILGSAPLDPRVRAEAERHFATGNGHQTAGRAEEAMTEFRTALTLCPDLAEARFNLGILQEMSGALVEARASDEAAALPGLDRALTWGPTLTLTRRR